MIGNGGAEYGVRGYVTAYDAETGAQAWRWFSVPGDPGKPLEDDFDGSRGENLRSGRQVVDQRRWRYRLGQHHLRSRLESDLHRHRQRCALEPERAQPRRRRDLYLGSIVALNADTGKYVWHYQETPGDSWDYTSTQPMILADINIDNAPRKVILHAPKNGFFFVIDRTNGKFISAKNFVDVNWATGYDAMDGRSRSRRPEVTSHSTASLDPTELTTGTRCRSIRRPASSTFPRKMFR